MPITSQRVTRPPGVVAGQVDVLPAQRREMLQEAIVNHLTARPQRFDGAPEIDRVPQGDGSDDQIEAAGTLTLVLEAPVA